MASAATALVLLAPGLAVGFLAGQRVAAVRHRRQRRIAARADFERWVAFTEAFLAWLEDARVPVDRLVALERAVERAFGAPPPPRILHRTSPRSGPSLSLVHAEPKGRHREGFEMSTMVNRRRDGDRRLHERRGPGDRRADVSGLDLGRRGVERRKGDRRTGERRGPGSL